MGSAIKPPVVEMIPVEEIKVPLALAKGQYEKVPNDVLIEHLVDIQAELARPERELVQEGYVEFAPHRYKRRDE